MLLEMANIRRYSRESRQRVEPLIDRHFLFALPQGTHDYLDRLEQTERNGSDGQRDEVPQFIRAEGSLWRDGDTHGLRTPLPPLSSQIQT